MRIKPPLLFALCLSLTPAALHAQYYENTDSTMEYYNNYIKRLEGPLIPKETPLHLRYKESRDRDFSSGPRTAPQSDKIPAADPTRQQLDNIDKANKEYSEQAKRDRAAVQREQRRTARTERQEAERERLERQLFTAIYAGDVPAVRDLLGKGVDPNAMYQHYTPLHYAAALRRLDVIMLLIADPKVDIGTEENLYFGLLHWAAYENHAELVKELVRRGARTDIKDQRGYTPLRYALSQKNLDLADYLKDH